MWRGPDPDSTFILNSSDSFSKEWDTPSVTFSLTGNT